MSMAMSDRFADLKKVAQEPAARLLANANAKIKSELASPANASVPAVLTELSGIEDERALIDMLRIISVAMPARELVWWTCLAARDVIGEVEDHKLPRTLTTAEAWVYKPGDKTRAEAGDAMETAEQGDPAKLCAMAVSYHDGALGVGEMAKIQAPPGAAGHCAFAVNIKAITKGEDFRDRVNLLIDRALDIARGGDGRSVGAAGPEASEKEGV